MPLDDNPHPPEPATDRAGPVQSGQITVMQIADINATGVFLDQGLDKQLLLPHNELHGEVRVGDRVVIVVLEDSRGRLYASSKLTRHLDFEPWGLQPGTPVSLLVYGSNERGHRCVVDGRHAGMLFRDRTHQPVALGDTLQGYVVEVQPEGKIDVSLRQPGVDPFSQDLDELERRLQSDGYLALNDKSPPAVIRAELGISKKAFKRAVGALYKRRLVAFDGGGIRWIGPES